jgi:hypothetical protein
MAIASGDEAAAIAAAIARFEAENAENADPASGVAPNRVSPWQRVALLEGVGAKQSVLDSEGGPRWLS